MFLNILHLLMVVAYSKATTCSKVVRKVIQQELSYYYVAVEGQMPLTCPLHQERDIYGHQEAHKYQESPSKWVCDFCGKAFYEERWLNEHYNNRHPDSLRQGNSVTCLADYCDVFRCDILTGTDKATYWDAALGKDSDLHQARSNCHVLIDQCTPTNIMGEEKLQFQEKLKKTVCGFLNCKKYWDVPVDKVKPLSTAVYVMAAILLSVGVIVYYYVVYSHFYTDESLIKQWKEMDAQYDNMHRYPSAPSQQYIRHRGSTRR